MDLTDLLTLEPGVLPFNDEAERLLSHPAFAPFYLTFIILWTTLWVQL